MKAVVLAGGKGARLAPYTRIFPKPMMPVGDKAILEILLHQMRRAGITEVILTVGHLAGLMRAFFQDGRHLGLKITYSYEEHPLGTAGPLAMLEGLDDTFLVTNGDVLTTLEICDLLRFHRENQEIATIATHQRQVHIDLGVIHTDHDNEIFSYTEKPTLNYQVSMGMYVFEPKAISYVPRCEYFDFPDLVKKMLGVGEKVVAYPFEGYWKDLGHPDDYEQANLDFDLMRSQFLPEENE